MFTAIRWTRRSHGALAAVLAGAAVFLGACGGGSSDSGTTAGNAQSGNAGGSSAQGRSTQGNGILTIAVTSPVATLNPALLNANPSYLWMDELAYDSLIRYEQDGSYRPGLATKFGYVGSGNEKFELTLRPDVKFADGTPVDAAAVAASLQYAFKTGTSGPVRAPNFRTAKATGPRSVLISCSGPCPALPLLLSQSGNVGSIISPAGLRDKKALASRSFGAGPYVLNTKETVGGDHYTYDANPGYWNKSGVHYKRVVVRIVSGSNARIAALKSGQADIIDYVPLQQAKTVTTGGLKILPEPSGVVGVLLRDRTGRRSEGDPPGSIYAPQLANPLVRKALSYAIDRKTLTSSFGYGYVTPSDQWTSPSAGGYDPSLEGRYAYDPKKAKALLAQAGYPNGFTLKVLSQKTNGNDSWQLAINQYWEAIGVKVQLKDTPDLTTFFANAPIYPVVDNQYGAGSLTYAVEVYDYYSRGGWTNGYVPDPKITKMIAQASAAPAEEAQQIYLDINRYAVENAFNIGIGQLSYLFAYNSSKVVVPMCPKPSGVGKSVNCAPILTDVKAPE